MWLDITSGAHMHASVPEVRTYPGRGNRLALLFLTLHPLQATVCSTMHMCTTPGNWAHSRHREEHVPQHQLRLLVGQPLEVVECDLQAVTIDRLHTHNTVPTTSNIMSHIYMN